MPEDLTDAEIIARLEICLRRMPRIRREIFLAIRLDDMGYAEIAELTGLSARRVERHFAKALYQLTKDCDERTKLSWWRRLTRWTGG